MSGELAELLFQGAALLVPRRFADAVAGCGAVVQPWLMADDDAQISWRSTVSDAELVELTESHGGSPLPGWWDRLREHSLGWVTARSPAGQLVGFVNVAWDGGDHAFLIDTKTRPSHQHRGLGTAVVARAVQESRAAGCEWLFVDFGPDLTPFYIESCGFEPTPAGLVRLKERS
ncbi:GNAT family N-acetyltransferase [Ruania halotolerans]|uniref:GNAT family N-acetyltransferase n=1 Tax=Ruania halotolerans TaxID=2897773 RepID=UPI001E5C8F68|nr:GNAT family N-acetyltransferase [Ruania halotolerans]UFU06595.1 GNAT family N-acetyltransferase [Ruania halotolerans]